MTASSAQPDQPDPPAQKPEQPQRQNRPPRRRMGCLGRQIRLFVFTMGITIALVGSCAIFTPVFFSGMVNAVRNAGLNTYVLVLKATGSKALKVTAYEVDVTGIGRVQRDMGALGLLYGEGAEVQGTVRIALGADIDNKGFGILSCAVDTDSIRTTVGRAPLAGTANDSEKIEQEAYAAFKTEAAKRAVEGYWADAKKRLGSEFVTWGLGLDVPDVPTLTDCPTISTSTPSTASTAK